MRLEFVTSGSAHAVAKAIEEYAARQGHVTAIVVPWESTATTLNMSVTSVRADGWAIEHTNLGTVTLTDLGNGTTAVAVRAADLDTAENDKLASIFDRFARQLETRFVANP